MSNVFRDVLLLRPLSFWPITIPTPVQEHLQVHDFMTALWDWNWQAFKSSLMAQWSCRTQTITVPSMVDGDDNSVWHYNQCGMYLIWWREMIIQFCIIMARIPVAESFWPVGGANVFRARLRFMFGRGSGVNFWLVNWIGRRTTWCAPPAGCVKSMWTCCGGACLWWPGVGAATTFPETFSPHLADSIAVREGVLIAIRDHRLQWIVHLGAVNSTDAISECSPLSTDALVIKGEKNCPKIQQHIYRNPN